MMIRMNCGVFFKCFDLMGSKSKQPQMFSHLLNKRTPSKGVLEVLVIRKTYLLVLVTSDTFLTVASFKFEFFYWTSAWTSCAGLCLQFPLVSVVSLVRWLMSAADGVQL